jgi:hypothetical protein
MYYVRNWKSSQLRKLFKIYKSSLIQSLSIFGTLEGICFVFQTLEEIEIHLEKFKPTRAHLSAARLPFNRATQLPGPTPAHHRAGHQAVTTLMVERASVPVTAGRH